MGRRLSELGFTIMTAGGPGVMEAANRGAKDGGGRSVGCNIGLPHEQQPNRCLDRSVTCQHFFVRKVLLFTYSYAFVALPGGIGTMDELFEALTLVQTHKIKLMGIIPQGAGRIARVTHESAHGATNFARFRLGTSVAMSPQGT